MLRPNFTIGPPDNPYLLRWYLIPRNRWFNIYLHLILRSDERTLHDHPWWFFSFILWGGYWEYVGQDYGQTWSNQWTWRNIKKRWRRVCSLSYCPVGHAHRIELPIGRTSWTLIFTGPKVRSWYFYCPKGKVEWRDYVDQTATGNTAGKGCD